MVYLTATLFLLANFVFFSLAEEAVGAENADVTETSDFSSDAYPTGRFLLSIGETQGVSFEKWDFEKKRFLFQKKNRRFAFESAQFLSWGAPAELSAAEATLVLANGGVWEGNPVGFQTRQQVLSGREERTGESAVYEILTWENSLCGTLDFFLNDVGGVLFGGTAIPEREKLIHEILTEKRSEDTLVFRTGERLSGEFLSWSDEKIRFQTRELSSPSLETFSPPVRVLEISQQQLAALLLSTEMRLEKNFLAQSVGPYFWIGLSDGSLFRLNPDGREPDLATIPRESIVYLESPQESQKFFDATLTSTTAQIRELRWLDEMLPQATEMRKNHEDEDARELEADERVADERESGELGADERGDWSSRASISGERFRVCGEIHRHGIGTETGVSLSWRLDGGFKTFGAVPACGERASSEIRFRVWLDGRLASEKIVTFGMKPELLLVDVQGAEELRLEAESVNRQLFQLKFPIHWLDAFLVP